MILELVNYAGQKKSVDIGELDDIAHIIIMICSGDEKAVVIGKDYSMDVFDPFGRDRLMDYDDVYYTLYNIHDPSKNYIFDYDFMYRKNCYEFPEKLAKRKYSR